MTDLLLGMNIYNRISIIIIGTTIKIGQESQMERMDSVSHPTRMKVSIVINFRLNNF